MIASTHLTAGAMVGVLSYRFLFKSGSIWGLAGALLAGVVSHFLLDMIPHSEEELYGANEYSRFMSVILSVELGLTFLAIYFCGINGSLRDEQNLYLLAGMIGGALPDVPHVLMESLKINWEFLQAADRWNVFFHTSLHPASFWQGLMPQIMITIFSLTVLYFFKTEPIKV